MGTPIDKDFALSKAKIALLAKKNAVFISTIVMSLKSSWSTQIPTACTDGVELLLNENFFLNCNPLEQIGLLAHEAWHVALQHMLADRISGRNFKVFNMAADHVINLMLLDNGYRLPKGGLADPQFKGMSTEEVYNILIKDPSLQDPNFQEDIQIGGQTPDQQQAIKNQVTQTLVRAATQARMAGDNAGGVPGDVEILLEELLYPKLPWNVILQEFLNGLSKEDYTFQRPNKRFIPNHYLPSLFSEGMGELACAVDTSGSVSDYQFKCFATEMDYIKETMNPSKMYVVDFDTQINSIYDLGDGDSVKQLQFKGRGGTSLHPVFEHFTKRPPQVLLIFSDLECEPIEKDPGYPVVWIKLKGHGHNPEFGRVIDFETD